MSKEDTHDGIGRFPCPAQQQRYRARARTARDVVHGHRGHGVFRGREKRQRLFVAPQRLGKFTLNATARRRIANRSEVNQPVCGWHGRRAHDRALERAQRARSIDMTTPPWCDAALQCC